jgi:alpha-D-xyloside xylohydrolase
MDFASDKMALEQKYEFMFGKELLVAPVTSPSVTTAEVYLPAVDGGWYDFWTEKPLRGAETVTSSAPMDTIPVYVRAGSILPLGPVEQYVEQKRDGPMELRIYPGHDGTFTLYDDEGSNYDYESGQSSMVVLTWKDRTHELLIGKRAGSFAGMRPECTLLVHVAGSAQAPREVHYRGEAMRIPLK